ncbi:Ff.00g062590.m01.CDS01 [Fusarium sp. VM40]|nr:Ff.00g062590.m01.CDS01 [Fusarium sp. VM40]
MAPPAVSPLVVPRTDLPLDFPEAETQLAKVNAQCTSLSHKALTSWLHHEGKSQLDLLQAAWCLCLGSYTGSEDVWFSSLSPNSSYYCHVLPSKPVRSLFDRRNVESVEEINATYWGANSAVFIEGENEEASENFTISASIPQRAKTHYPGVEIHYKPSLISPDLAGMIAATVVKAFEEIVFNIDSTVGDLDICSDADIERLTQWNRPISDELLSSRSIHHVISHMTATQPDSIAVSAWDGEFTYRDLNRLSSGLAIWLQQLGVGPEVFVSLVFDKSKWAVVAQLGVLKAGGAYFFINPSHPIDYTRKLGSSVSPIIAVCSPRYSSLAEELACEVIAIGDEVRELLNSIPVDDDPQQPSVGGNTSDAMYVTFTSGTTGLPKGIVTEHSAFYAMAMANGKALKITSTTRMLQFASYTFDVSNRDTLVTLMFGGCVCIPSETDRLDDLAGFLNRRSVNTASLTPSMANTLNPASCSSLQKLVLGGEPMTDSHISMWASHVRLFNAYGVSESTGIAALSEIKPGSSPSSIGYGCGSNLWVVAIHQPDKLAPIGALGELVLEGPSVSRGYLGDKERTDKHFTSSPAWKQRLHEHSRDQQRNSRAFHTGDLVRYNLDGSLQLMGRRDHQVKVNGQRLELTAVEHHIASCSQVAKEGFCHTAVVAVKSGQSDSTKLIAFLGLDTSREPLDVSQLVTGQLRDVEKLREAIKGYLHGCLPKYMIPSEFIFLQHMPLTTSGKLNRLLLQNTATQALVDAMNQNDELDGFHLTNGHVATTLKQRILMQIWSKLLGVEENRLSPKDCFFRRGGDSMAAIKMAASLREEGFTISVSDIFKSTVLSDMASVLINNDEHVLATTPDPFSLLETPQELLREISEEVNLSIDDIEDVYPCTHMQQGLIALTAQDSQAYIASYTWPLADDVDVHRFQDAWNTTWLNNPILRSRVVQTAHGIFQVVTKTDIPWTDVANVAGTSTEIDINHGPLVRFYMSKESFRLDIHHSLFDEWSLGLILTQVERAYSGAKLEMQPFSPFVRHLLHQKDSSEEKFWRQEFSQIQAEHFPSTSKLGQTAEKVILEHFLHLDAEVSTKYTLSSILRLAWAIVLWHQTGSHDVVFGATVSGRNANLDGIDRLSGPTLATLPVRIKLTTDRPIHESLAQVQNQFINMMAHEQTGLSRIKQFGQEAAEACNFQNLLVVQPHEQTTESIIFKTPVGSSSENMKAFASYPLVLTCRPEKSGVSIKMTCDRDIMTPDAGDSLLRQLSQVAQQLVSSEDMLIGDVDMMPPQDMASLKEWNTSLPKSVDTCIHERIQQLCAIQPDALAIHSENLDLSYAQLEAYSTRFAQHLISRGVKQGDFVPILSERSPWAPVLMLAVLNVGAAFVLLDLSHPIQRLRTMCSIVEAKTLVSFNEHANISDKLSLPVITFDPELFTKEVNGQSCRPLLPTLTQNMDAPACVVFSSGSTGVPKGIVLSHSAIATSATVMREHGMLAPESRVFHFASFAFDISIGEILFTLSAGACICVPQEGERRDNPAKAAGDLKVTWALLTPSVINLFDPADVPTLKIFGSCGEPLTTQIVDIWADRLSLFAMYAPAECTVISHIGRIFPDTHSSNIGRSFGASSWVVDPADHNRLVPIGTVGELLVEGPVVASGYLNDQKRTDQVFISKTSWLAKFRSNSGRMYKTGDLVRQTTDGSLQFLGRKDDQVKLHGQRLEVGEVAHSITSVCTAVKTAAVECIKIADQNNRVSLVAFLAPQNEGAWGQQEVSENGFDLIATPNDDFYSTIANLHVSLAELLPSYMIPSYFIPLSYVPLSLSGKVNRRFLREQSTIQLAMKLQLYQLRDRSLPSEDVPITEHGREIQKIVGQALHLDPESIPINASFFGLGGDSISAMVVSTLARRRGINLTVADIFTHQTLSKIALVCAPDNAATNNVASLPNGNGSTGPGTSVDETPHEKIPSHVPREIADNILEVTTATEFQVMTLYNFYNRYLWISLPDDVDEERLQAACDQLVQKHSILRTVFYTNDDKSVVQLTLREVPVNLVHHSNIESLEEHCADDSLITKAPVNGEPGFQIQLLKLRDSRTFLALRLPHALFDGMSLSTICDDLSSAYSGSVIPPCAQFSDHVQHVKEKTTPDTYKIWKDVLGGTPMTNMSDKTINRERMGESKCATFDKDMSSARVVTARAETEPISPPTNSTMATLVKLAWAITLSRLFPSTQSNDASGEGLSDVVFGQVVHGRSLGIPHEDRIIGPCLNIIPVRVHFPKPADKHQLLSQVQQQHIQTMPVENLGLGEIARNCTSWEPGTKFGSFVRFQNFTNNDDPTCDFDGRTCETGLFSLPNKPSSTANVLVVPRGSSLSITMTISSQVLDEELADYVVGYFSDVIESLAKKDICEYFV